MPVPVVNSCAKTVLVLVLELCPVLLMNVVTVCAALTVMSNSSLTEAVPSLAVTFTETVSAAVGVPEKVRCGVSERQPGGEHCPVGLS